MLHDLALLIAPPLERDVEELALVDGAGFVGSHPSAKRSTSRRCAASNHGGEPAAVLERARSALRVAGITRSTRSSERVHFSSACAQLSTPSSASAEAGGVCLRSAPAPSGRMTITAIPSDAA